MGRLQPHEISMAGLGVENSFGSRLAGCLVRPPPWFWGSVAQCGIQHFASISATGGAPRRAIRGRVQREEVASSGSETVTVRRLPSGLPPSLAGIDQGGCPVEISPQPPQKTCGESESVSAFTQFFWGRFPCSSTALAQAGAGIVMAQPGR